MWLAAELHRGGADVLVLEKRAERLPESRALTMYSRTVELFAMRGLVQRFLAAGRSAPTSHFAILSNRLDLAFLDSRYPFLLFHPQRRTEALLSEHLDELGVPVLSPYEVTGVRQSADSAEVCIETPSGPLAVEAEYVVGCDGAHSVVRRQVGIEFAGTAATWHSIVGDVEVADPPPVPLLTEPTPTGSFLAVALGDGRWRLATIDHAMLAEQPDGPVQFEQLRASMLRVAGTDFGMRDTSRAWLSRVGNDTRQATTYRAGRVLLAGDAAHIHFPAGGQGLNLGLQDAANLGWKLAAVIRDRAPSSLLDTYQKERAPVGLEVIEDTLAQSALFANPSREGLALRDRFNRLLGESTSLNQSLALRVSGLGIRYGRTASGPADPGGGPVPGVRVPDLGLYGSPASTIYGLLHDARFVLLLPPAAPGPEAPSPDVDVVRATIAAARPEWRDAGPLLIRPDGYLATAAATPAEPYGDVRPFDPIAD
jgi:2-polyprenyl-6-methoxyphenol hydroxylase-like FAD-dependent oxidoreductase